MPLNTNTHRGQSVRCPWSWGYRQLSAAWCGCWEPDSGRSSGRKRALNRSAILLPLTSYSALVPCLLRGGPARGHRQRFSLGKSFLALLLLGLYGPQLDGGRKMVHSCTALTAIVCDLVILSILSIQPAKQELPEHRYCRAHRDQRHQGSACPWYSLIDKTMRVW